MDGAKQWGALKMQWVGTLSWKSESIEKKNSRVSHVFTFKIFLNSFKK
jgi:hypothetical protein